MTNNTQGDFRVIGVIKRSDTDVVGYLMIPSTLGNLFETQSLKPRPMQAGEFYNFVRAGRVVNFEIDGDSVKCSEHADSRLMTYDIRGTSVQKKVSAIILAQVVTETRDVFYRIFDSSNVLRTVAEDTLLQLSIAGTINLINAKVVRREYNKPIISRIKGELPQIRVTREDIEGARNKVNGASQSELTTKGIKQVSQRNKDILIGNTLINAINKFFKNGTVRTIYSGEDKRKAGYFLKDFVQKEYPELLKIKDTDVSEIITAASVLALLDKKVITSPNNREVKYEKQLGVHSPIKVYYKTRGSFRNPSEIVVKKGIHKVSNTFIKVVRSYNEDLAIFYGQRNQIFDMTRRSGVTKGVQDELISELVSRLKLGVTPDADKAPKEKPCYTTTDIDFTSEEGFNTLGYTTIIDSVGSRYQSVMYAKQKELKYADDMFEHTGVDVTTYKPYLKSFGDYLVASSLIKATKDNFESDQRLLSTLISLNNPDLYAKLKEDNLAFNIPSDIVFEGQPTELDKMYYNSGCMFGKKETLVRAESWAGKNLNTVPEFTSNAVFQVITM